MKTDRETDACPFCEYTHTHRAVEQNDTFYAKYDEYPVSRGHTLLIPRRHIISMFELSEMERRDFFNLLLCIREIVQRDYSPDGFNIGVNDGAAAGQTVMHLHIHLIPRYVGDVPHPEGGIRRIIPNLTRYPPQAE